MRASGCLSAHAHRFCWSHLFAGAQMTKGGSGEQCDHQQPTLLPPLGASFRTRYCDLGPSASAHGGNPGAFASTAQELRVPSTVADGRPVRPLAQSGPRRALAATGGGPVDDRSNIDDSRAKDRPCPVQFAALVPPDPRECLSEVRAEARGVAKRRIEKGFHVASRNAGRRDGEPACRLSVNALPRRGRNFTRPR